MNWVILWKFVLIFTFSAYSILVIVVFFGGIKNIIEMFKDFTESANQSE
jgi:hypothetical protein